MKVGLDSRSLETRKVAILEGLAIEVSKCVEVSINNGLEFSLTVEICNLHYLALTDIGLIRLPESNVDFNFGKVSRHGIFFS